MARSDNKGYQYFANWHWVAFDLCQHHNDLFLPWHRGYLYHFELALQDIDADVTLPWWDWMDEAWPLAAYTDPEDEGKPNPLLGAPIEPWGVKPKPSWPKHTKREPGAVDEPGTPEEPGPLPPPLRKAEIGGQEVDLYAWMMASTTYREFEERCWRLHDNMHVWVGGTMSNPEWAGYDPIFYAHHAMVDRLWRIWQHNNPSALPSEEVLDTSLTFASEPSMTVREVLDVTQLGYDYAGEASAVPGTA